MHRGASNLLLRRDGEAKIWCEVHSSFDPRKPVSDFFSERTGSLICKANCGAGNCLPLKIGTDVARGTSSYSPRISVGSKFSLASCCMCSPSKSQLTKCSGTSGAPVSGS